ncbi:MAG: NADH-quinone oxidoreductase subunit NuoN [Lysobacterales bacterium]
MNPIDTTDLLRLYPEGFLLFSLCGLLLVDLFIAERHRAITHWLSIVLLGLTALLVWRLAGNEALRGAAFGGMFLVDGVATVAKLFILLTSAVVLVYAKPYLLPRRLFQGEFYTLVLFAVLGMMLLVSAGNLLIAYLGLELLALPLYALVALDRDNRRASEAAMKYFVLGALASGLLLFGMSLLYGASGSLDLGSIRAAAVSNSPHPWLYAVAVVFVVIGIAFKLGAVPFHMWIPDVYQGAPTAVTLFIASAPKIAGFGLAYRLLDGALDPFARDWASMLAVLALLSLVVGNVVAIAQTNFKRMLGYSTISHVGFLLLGLIAHTADGYGSALFYAVSYALTATAAFGLIILLSRSGFEAEEITDFSGLNQRNPWYALLMLLVMASFAGVPLLVGFLAKLQVLKAVIGANLIWLAIAAGLLAVVGAFYYLRVIKVMYFDAPAEPGALLLPKDLPFRLVLSANALALLGLGVFGGPLLSWCLRAAAGG